MYIDEEKVDHKKRIFEKKVRKAKKILNESIGVKKSKKYWSIIICEKINRKVEKLEVEGKRKSDESGENKRLLKKLIERTIKWKNESEKILRKTFVKIIEKKSKLKKVKKHTNREEQNPKSIESEIIVFGRKINFHKCTTKKIRDACEKDACDLEVVCGGLAELKDLHEPHSGEESLSLPDTEEMNDITIELLFEELGDGFVEEYMRAKKTVEDIVERWPSVILDAVPNDSLVQRVFVAEAVERGATLVSVQHGGWYGEVGYYGMEWVEKQISDVFATWGYENDDIDVGLPAAKLMNDRRVDPEGETLLWLSRSVDHWGDHLSPATFFDVIDGINGPNEGTSRFERSTKLYDALARDVRSDLLLRFDYKHRPDTEGHMRMLRWRIRKRFKQAKVDRKRRKLEECLGDARLVLVDHVPSTVFAECIHGGVPTILFDQIDEKWLTDNARQAYQTLEDAGVLYQNPEAAARKVDDIYADPVDWWKSSEVEAAVNEYKNEFAYVGDHPAEEWATFLQELHVRHTPSRT
jgi:hypothetical protein